VEQGNAFGASALVKSMKPKSKNTKKEMEEDETEKMEVQLNEFFCGFDRLCSPYSLDLPPEALQMFSIHTLVDIALTLDARGFPFSFSI
jgi:hypothetical protein